MYKIYNTKLLTAVVFYIDITYFSIINLHSLLYIDDQGLKARINDLTNEKYVFFNLEKNKQEFTKRFKIIITRINFYK